ncbi:MAG: class I SAM-dependent methyltransferase [Alistipes sp.]|jgi:hypothetical protein|nr:class I SAM-dependent methyltransferase [Alistipes sp.]
MTDDLEILLSDGFRRSVEENLGRDPLRIALDRSLPHAAIVASQVKYLRRAGSKFPSWHAARCIIPPLAFEQSSSEATAALKEYSGALAIDLTCGLGVDSRALSKRFRRVIALERDATLAAIARENFRRLGADNIEIVNISAEEFLSDGGIRADLVYADPDRRSDAGKKMVRPEYCSPDIIALLPAIGRVAPRLVVKLSPLFDIDEVFRVFGPNARAEVVSLDGECKEVIADVRFGSRTADTPGPVIRAVAIGLGEVEYPANDDRTLPELTFEPERYTHLAVPDVALQKARLARRYLTDRGIRIDSDNGYGFATERPGNIIGKVLEIESMEPFDPKELKRRLKARGIKSIDILKRDFPLSAADIARQSGVRQGGAMKIAFTKAAGHLWQITLRP